jgi:GNAT superfamily N-acetyltransferase
MNILQVTDSNDVISVCGQLGDNDWGTDNDMARYAVQELQEFVSNTNNMLVVCLVDGAVVSSALAYKLNHPDPTRRSIYIDEIDTRPSYRRKGYASAIIEWFRDFAPSVGLNEAWLTTESEDNEQTNAFYKALDPAENLKTVIYSYQKR